MAQDITLGLYSDKVHMPNDNDVVTSKGETINIPFWYHYALPSPIVLSYKPQCPGQILLQRRFSAMQSLRLPACLCLLVVAELLDLRSHVAGPMLRSRLYLSLGCRCHGSSRSDFANRACEVGSRLRVHSVVALLLFLGFRGLCVR